MPAALVRETGVVWDTIGRKVPLKLNALGFTSKKTEDKQRSTLLTPVTAHLWTITVMVIGQMLCSVCRAVVCRQEN